MGRRILRTGESASRHITEHSRVSRLPATLLAFGLVLLGGTAPALACAAVSTGDCCPDRGSVPCPEDGSGILASDAAVCCASTPVPAQATSYSPIRVQLQKPMHFGSPEFPLLPASTVAFAQAAARRGEELVPAGPSRHDASLTYLRTQRLRL
jgi:hypothetical protein